MPHVGDGRRPHRLLPGLVCGLRGSPFSLSGAELEIWRTSPLKDADLSGVMHTKGLADTELEQNKTEGFKDNAEQPPDQKRNSDCDIQGFKAKALSPSAHWSMDIWVVSSVWLLWLVFWAFGQVSVWSLFPLP